MFKIITELFSLLTPSQRRKFFVFQILIIIMTSAEIISIVSLVPFMALIGDISILERDNFLATLYIPFINPTISSGGAFKLKSSRSIYLPFGITKA